MRTFDLYLPAGTQSQGFFNQPPSPGTMTWIEKSGFHEGYFNERQTRDLLEFAVLAEGSGTIPRDPVAFEKLPFVEAEVMEPNDNGAKIAVRSATTLGEWARGVYSLGKSSIQSIPEESRPPASILEPLQQLFRSREGAVWVADAPPADPKAPSAVYLFKCDSDRRCLVLTSSAASSYLVKI